MADETVTHPSAEDLAARRELAASVNHEIQHLAEAAVILLNEMAETIAVEGILKRIQQLTEIMYFTQRLHGSSDADAGAPDLERLRRMFNGGLPV